MFDSPVVKAIRILAGLLGADDPESQVLGLMNPVDVGAPGGLVGAIAKRIAKPIKAYHGSPHDFDQFSLGKIGTGEGAQAYGHGLYFAESEGVARSYRDALAQQTWNDRNVGGAVFDALSEHGTIDGKVPFGPNQSLRSRDDLAEGFVSGRYNIFDLPVGLRRKVEALMPRGRMYEVNIHAEPESFLDWDKPLSQQSESVRAFARQQYPERFADMDRASTLDADIRSIADQYAEPGDSYVSAIGRAPEDVQKHWRDLVAEHRRLTSTDDSGSLLPSTGADLYRAHGFPESTTEAMRNAGIQGIRYLDQGSRSAGEGTSNYVVFDDRLVEILRKYGLLPPVAAGAFSELSDER